MLAVTVRISVVAAILASAAYVGCSSPRSARAASVKPDSERKQAPDLSLRDSHGRTLRLSDYAGKVVLLDFWATWCGPCKIEIPWLIDFERRYKDKGFAVIGISMDEGGWDAVKPFASRLGINYRIVLGDEDIAQQFGGVDALPTTFLIDREGKVAAAHVGLTSKSDIEDGIEQLLQAPPGSEQRASADPVVDRLARPTR